MQPIRRLMQSLAQLAGPEHYLFTPDDLRAILPDLTESAFNTLLSRATKQCHLIRLCRGLYLFDKVAPITGLLLFHAAARLRADYLNYISLETVLSDSGVISQIPINRITVMSSGRSSVISCGRWGSIEFVHTCQKPQELVGQIYYDTRCKLWRAKVPQALRDMRATHRSTDLIDWSVANGLV
ncbi:MULTISPECIES: type IV toxin-antitoxin system AbiEi family antitoxin [Methylobacter]|uniref:type IV toxin-antitoxin system AbiEi family antitoxin n=1 Tax=Methylobacter TaxID=429 RepID=UPI001FADCDF2|nr:MULTISPECIES: hypothetical protein [Methylobacter]UOA07418.1 hypothetical protein KKZ03_14195 [Methylobacter sp. S3L5C]